MAPALADRIEAGREACNQHCSAYPIQKMLGYKPYIGGESCLKQANLEIRMADPRGGMAAACKPCKGWI